MRQLLGRKKLNRLRLETGLDIVKVMVRGNNDHAKSLCLKDGSIVMQLKDGSIVASECRWDK